jgi:hypothetical protein
MNHYDQSILNKSRKDKFILTLNLPKELIPHNKKVDRSNNNLSLDMLQFSIYGVVVPKNIIPQEDARYSGGNVYVSSHSKPSYDPVSVNFTIDNEFNNYWVIHKWLDLLRNEKTGIYDGIEIYNKDMGLGRYSTDFIVTAKDEFHNDIIQWTYKTAFPVGLGDIIYSYRDGAEIETSFDFVFRRVETNLLKV